MQLPKIHLRDYFWFVLVLGMAIGWYRDHRLLDGMIIASDVLMAANQGCENQLGEMEAIKNAYHDRLNEFGSFAPQKLGPLQYEIVSESGIPPEPAQP